MNEQFHLELFLFESICTLTSPTIDVSFLREFDHDYSPELGQLMLPCWVAAPVFSDEFPLVESESPVSTDVYR